MSSSSSMCELDEFFSYHPLGNYQEPWYDYYQTMGHPLVYYAEVQPSSRKSRSGVRKDPNFFVKAFRWYTQEHHPPNQGPVKSVNNLDFSGFANWLDAKYGEYIQEGQKEQCCNQLAAPESRKPKKLLASMKSHFTKRHKTRKDDTGRKRSCNSCEYIMMPKDMPLIGSECLRRRSQSSAPQRARTMSSNIKAVCSNTQEKKGAMKSVSMTSSRYDVDYQKSIEIVLTEGDTNDKPDDNCSCAKTEVLTIYESKPNNVNDVGIGPLPCDPSNVNNVCGCGPPRNVNAYTQYDKNMSAPIPPVIPTQAVPSKSKVEMQKQDKNSNKPSVVSMSKKNVSSRKSPKTSDISCMCSLERVPTAQSTKSTKSKSTHECQCTASFQDAVKTYTQKNTATDAVAVCSCAAPQPAPMTLPIPMMPLPPPPAPVVTPIKTGCLCSIRVNEAMQTSDTSIRLDDEVIKYPFFMKIVRADKLITDCY